MNHGVLVQGKICKESNRTTSSQVQKVSAMRDIKNDATGKNITLVMKCYVTLKWRDCICYVLHHTWDLFDEV